MPIFDYRGYKADGGDVAGTLEADSPKDALSKVKGLGFFPSLVTEHVHKDRFWSRKNIKASIPDVTRQLSTMLSAGVPLLDALKSLSDESAGAWKSLLLDVRERVSSGASLSRALQDTNIFPDFYTNMVAAGEQSGTLDRILPRLADFLDKQADLEGRVRTALIYPTFMICISFIVISFLFAFVIPKIVGIFNNYNAVLPLVTRILIFVSNFFINYWWLIITVLGAAVFTVKRTHTKNRQLIDGLLLRVPGNVVQSLYYGRFARMLGLLLNAGLPILKAIGLASKSVGNTKLQASLLTAERKVMEGANLSSSLEGFPPIFVQLVATGEKTGKLPEVLNRAADSYEEEFSRRVQRLLSVLEPAMILIMGLVVGFIVFAVLLPMFQLNQLVR